MNRDRARKLLPIIQAFAEGKDVQFKVDNDSGWVAISSTHIVFSDNFDYRIKPEPEVIWVNKYDSYDDIIYSSEEKARAGAGEACTHVAKKFIAEE